MSIANQPNMFISYASADRALAEEVYGRLTAAGFDVWFDIERLKPGFDWHKEIEEACEACRVVLPVLTPRWKTSEWTKFETYGAEAIIPLVCEGEWKDVITPPLAKWQRLDLQTKGVGSLCLDGPEGAEHKDSRPLLSDDAAWEKLFTQLKTMLAQPAADKAQRVIDVRYQPNPNFVGREQDLQQIHEALHQNPAAVLTQGRVRAITALGGIGKTTLARQYIEKFWRCYPQIFWIDCRIGVESEFARLCDLLLPALRDSTNVAEKSVLALRELNSRNERLLIIDNAEDESSIQAWIPKIGNCRTLITSRFAKWSAAIRTFRLAVLDPESARTLLVNRGGKGDFAQLVSTEQTACEQLAKQLGWLPLALEQAAAYIEQQGAAFSFADYLRLHGEATKQLLAAGVLGSTEYPDSVMTTWSTTLQKLSPGSRAILRLCSFLAPTLLPLTVLIDGVEELLDEAEVVAGSPPSPPEHDEFWVREQTEQLRKYSMAETDGKSLTFHPLVQTVQRLNLNPASGEHFATLERSLNWINAAFQGDSADVRTWPTLEPLALHAHAAVQHADQAAIAEPTARLLSSMANLIQAKAQYAEAEPLMRRTLEINETSRGQTTLSSRFASTTLRSCSRTRIVWRRPSR